MYRELSKKLQVNSQIKFEPYKTPVQILYGTRRVGKSTLLKNTFPNSKYINIEDSEYNDVFETKNISKIRDLIESIIGKDRILILDEFQKLTDPGLIAKLIYDSIDDVKLILSGSSTLEIANKSSESLAGRAITNILFPLTFKEKLTQAKILETNNSTVRNLIDKSDSLAFKEGLLESMRIGLYPSQLENFTVESYLENLVDSYLLKDLLYLELIRNTKVISDLLILLAYQIGSNLNYSNISSILGIDIKSVKKYIGLLENLFIIYRIRGYRNKRKDEIGKSEKVYFYDLGIRNALTKDWNAVKLRNDFGHIFENFVINEFTKINAYEALGYDFRYWRTSDGAEVDLLLCKGGKIEKAYEIKATSNEFSSLFKTTYPEVNTETINLENLAKFIL